MITCPRCNEPIYTNWSFCRNCGTKLKEPTKRGISLVQKTGSSQKGYKHIKKYPTSGLASEYSVTFSRHPLGYIELAHELAHRRLGHHNKPIPLKGLSRVKREIEAWNEVLTKLNKEDKNRALQFALWALSKYMKVSDNPAELEEERRLIKTFKEDWKDFL